MANLGTVAQEAGVSITTASRVLNGSRYAQRISEPCAQRVREAAKRLGYTANYHARSIKLGRAETIGLALELGAPDQKWQPKVLIGNTYYQAIIAGIEAATHAVSYNLSLIGPRASESAIERGVVGIKERRLDGLLIVGIALGSGQNAVLLEAPDLPIVVIQAQVPTALPVVDFDDVAGVSLAVRHLAELGHKELLWLGPASSEDLAHSTERERRFMTEVWDRGLRGSSCRFDAKCQGTGNPIQDMAHKTLTEFMAQSPRRFTAVVCYNDLIAIGAARALLQQGVRIPQGVSVVGFDNAEAALAYPPLTTVDHKFTEIGQRAAEWVLKMVAEGEDERHHLRGMRDMIAPELVIRESTGPAPEMSGSA